MHGPLSVRYKRHVKGAQRPVVQETVRCGVTQSTALRGTLLLSVMECRAPACPGNPHSVGALPNRTAGSADAIAGHVTTIGYCDSLYGGVSDCDGTKTRKQGSEKQDLTQDPVSKSFNGL